MSDLDKYAKKNGVDLDTLVKQAAKSMPSILQRRKSIPEGLAKRLAKNDLNFQSKANIS